MPRLFVSWKVKIKGQTERDAIYTVQQYSGQKFIAYNISNEQIGLLRLRCMSGGLKNRNTILWPSRHMHVRPQ